MITPSVWTSIESLIEFGINLVAVYDKGSNAKKSCGPWAKFQIEFNTKEDLYSTMNKYDTSAVAMMCGKISGNLEVIDIDSKHKKGIDIKLLALIKEFEPELYAKLRIHRTPSGGKHIIYRVDNYDVPPGRKVASRPATEDELIRNPQQKSVCFIETRGEKNLCMSPPSANYEQMTDNEIPILSSSERDFLIYLCESLNEVTKVAPTLKPTKTEGDIYDENPFEHFNRSCEPIKLLEDFGWVYIKHNADYVYFAKPRDNKSDKKISASFSFERRTFRIFTDQTAFEPGSSYLPASVLAILKFGGDKSRTYKYLVSEGFGQLKRKVETSIIKKAALSGGSIPNNFSADAKKVFEELKITIQEDHPYGIFWDQDDEGKVSISREGVYEVSSGLGFRLHNGSVTQIIKNVIHQRTDRYYFDTVKSYIKEDDGSLMEDICNAYEAFVQKSGAFTISRLPELDSDLILTDTIDTCFKFFNNGYLKITVDAIERLNYDDHPDLLIWDHSIQKRDYNFGDGGLYIDYLKKAVTDFSQAQKVLGYLSHEYKDETTGYIIVLTEQCPDPKQGGGSGKNVFCNLLKLTTTYTSKPGSQAKFDEKFFQSWNGQRIFGISDVAKNFDFSFLKEPSTGSFILKKLFKDEVEVDVKLAPKFIVQTNFSYEISDGGLKRRIIPLEFTDFFTKAGGLDVHYNAHFPNGWTEDDYAGFDTLIATSVQEWLKAGRKLRATELTHTGWLKQWEQTYSSATGFILSNWDKWVEDGYITNEDFKSRMESYFNENNVAKMYWPSPSKLNAAIAAYSEKHGILFMKDKNKRFANGQFKCRIFQSVNDPTDPDHEYENEQQEPDF